MDPKVHPLSTTCIYTCTPITNGKVTLLPGLFKDRYNLNRQYMLSLKTHNLLQNYYMEAGLWSPRDRPEDIHWGWESPTCQVRGHFLGHWLSAAAEMYAGSGDQEIKGKADYIISELAHCQVENGGEWAGSIPEKYMDWLGRGKKVWAPQYTLHKSLMGLYDMYAWAGNKQALDILVKWTRWFYRWSSQYTRPQWDGILDIETGGMLEVWANLYGVTGEKEHYELMQRYDRRHLFDPLVAGKDVLVNQHANTTIPEALGAARAWEVTGEERWRQVVEAYWRSAVTDRGYYCTGGQNNGEVWSPPGQLSARLGEKTQEHCTVFNMMRLAAYLQKWTGEAAYADYWERNLYNGILAQQNPHTGMVTYWLPLRSGSVKQWGSPTEDFWCCHGSLVQAHSMYANHIFYQEGRDLVLSQYIPSQLELVQEDNPVNVSLSSDTQVASVQRPSSRVFLLKIVCARPQEFGLKFRLPWWLSGAPQVTLNGETLEVENRSSSYAEIRRMWDCDTLRIELPQALTACPLPDRPETVAFMEGPLVLAGVLEDFPAAQKVVKHTQKTNFENLEDVPTNLGIERLVEKTLFASPVAPTSVLTPDNEREWHIWRTGYRTTGQPENLRLIPLYEICEERYQVYFPVRENR
jgi:uncharacterized protein